MSLLDPTLQKQWDHALPSTGSMVPLLLQGGTKEVDIGAFLLHVCRPQNPQCLCNVIGCR